MQQSWGPSINLLAKEAPSALHGSYHWLYERALSVATLGAVGAAFVAPGKGVDLALGALLPLHSHIGFGAIITDYLPKHRSPKLYIAARSLLYLGTAGTLYGLYQYNTRDVGICEGVRSLWRAKAEHALREDA